MNIQDYLTKYSMNQSEFADLVEVNQGMVSQWLKNKRPISLERCLLIEQKTNGEITCKDLRPDKPHWSELLKKKAA